MLFWLMLLLTTAVRAGDDITADVRTDDNLTPSSRASDELTTANLTSYNLTTIARISYNLTTTARTADMITYCEKLEKAMNVATEKRNIYVQGRAVPLFVQWDGHAPARAAAALLQALLARGCGYRGVSLKRVQEQSLAEIVYTNNTIYHQYNELVVWPAAAQRMDAAASVAPCGAERVCGLRLAALGPGAAPAAVTLLAHLAEHAAHDSGCQKANAWPFYANETALRRCGFLEHSASATVYFLSERKALAGELTNRAKAYNLRWELVELGADAEPRKRLLQLLRAGNQSFLFLDYEVWSTSPRVMISQPPPCTTTPCSPSLDPVYTVRLANVRALEQFLPAVPNIIRKFFPTQQEIREILEEEADIEDVEQAACSWSLNNIPRFKSWIESDINPTYWIVTFLCVPDPDYAEYRRTIRQVYNAISSDLKFNFQLHTANLTCSDENEMRNILSEFIERWNSKALIGVIGVGVGVESAADLAMTKETVLVVYDDVANHTSLGYATRVTGGSVSQLTSAIAWFLDSCEWTRLAVISDQSSIAKAIYEGLSKTSLVLRNQELLSHTDAEVKLYLKTFRELEARIFYVNTDADTAARVLCTAMELNMTFDEGYVWLVRGWRARNRTCGSAAARASMRHYTVSSWWRGQHTDHQPDPADINLNVTKNVQSLWRGAAWPQRAAPLADGALLLLRAASTFFTRHPARSHDLHGYGTARVFWESLNDTIPGVRGRLHGGMDVASPRVYIDEWRDGTRPHSLAVWPVSAHDELRAVCGQRTDGGKRCITTRWYRPGETFVWRCHDWAFLLSSLAVTLAVPALVIARRARLARLTRRERMLKARSEAVSRRTAAALGGRLVARASLELRRELGAGRFGRVRLAVLRAPGQAPHVVAAKALPEDATASEEDDFLKEACILASLQHEHIVQLVGVCASDGPPLVLMEYAFFGDLAAYLRARRHLAERIDQGNEEAEHVSAESLTRLASEAASALAYLATKRLVHRDVRAANCLVDARRALKLADFGLARHTAHGAEYACARRGFFPVLWMAPESLDRGVFSAASDVWALGVLMLELVTLGERPYGDCSPLAVFRHVVGGGRPPLPPDASVNTIGVLTMCWRRLAWQRPSAEAVCAYLRARPAALQPALTPAPPPSHDTPPHTPSRLSLCDFMQ